MMQALVAKSTSVSCKMWITDDYPVFKPETNLAVYCTALHVDVGTDLVSPR